eukprot:TRINITY_DN7218_c0_g1_i1.p1 TRINITY_DN7218_c0_g1~~TRINITY_DN7218_c0_g1_i1.p1  ORF type:complete len:346 (+),score=40.43 TRINITY_DN7218_c0_g1_i1:64-1101(+)
MPSMANTSRSVRFSEPDIEEYKLVKFKVSWKGALYHTPGLGEDEMVEFDADLLERQGQKQLSKRVHGLLALGRAAELRASVAAYLQQGSASRLPDIVVPKRTERPSAPPASITPRSRRPAPRTRHRNISPENSNAKVQAKGDVDLTSGETARQNEPASMADAACPSIVSRADSVEREADASVPAREVIEPGCTPEFSCSAGRSHKTARTSCDHECWSDTDQEAHGALQRHFRTLTHEHSPENSAETVLKGQLPFSPVPPAVRPRAPPPHRKFRRDGNSQSSSASVEDFGPVPGVHLETSTALRQQFSVNVESNFADQDYAVLSGADVFEEALTRCADLPPRPSSI